MEERTGLRGAYLSGLAEMEKLKGLMRESRQAMFPRNAGVLPATCRGLKSSCWKSSGLAVLLTWVLLGRICPAQETGADWQGQIRALVSASRLEEAERVVEAWIKTHPDDLEARGWHARLLSWTNHWGEAEAEYRRLLEVFRDDTDLLAGLADVLTWQRRYGEALPWLERACRLAPERSDCQLRRARVLQSLGRARDAQEAYRRVLAKDATSAEAKAGLEQLREGGRHELRVGGDVELLNFAQNAGAVAASLRSKLHPRVSSLFAVTQQQRFGEQATRFGAESTVRLSSGDNLTTGGAVARDLGVIPRSEAYFEYGHGFQWRGNGPVRGLESLYQQRWLWYRDARVLVFSPGAILYLPKDWTWLFRASAARNRFAGSAVEWRPSGWTRLSFPLSRNVSGHLLFASGTENFGVADQIGRFSARTWGSGLKFRLAPGQEITTYGHFQSRSQGRSQTSFGVSYAIRF